MDAEEHRSTTVFREYLRIKSIQPEPDYGKLKSSLYSKYEGEVQIQRENVMESEWWYLVRAWKKPALNFFEICF